MPNKRFILIATMLIVGTIVAAGAAQVMGVNVPPGDIVDSPNANIGNQSPPAQVPDAPAPSSASANILFSDDFAQGNLDLWEDLQTQAEQAPASWIVRDNRLQQAGDPTGNSSDENATLVAKDISLSDGTFEVSVFNTSGSPVGLLFRGTDNGNYRLVIHSDTPGDSPKLLLQNVTGTETREIASAPKTTWPGYTPGQWHNVAVTLTGPAITVTIDGAPVLTANDTTHTSGWIGIWSLADTTAQFDNVRVQTSNP